MNDTINVLGYKGCNSEVFCKCAVAAAVASGPSPEDFEARRMDIASRAYHNAIGHPCTEVAKGRCGGWTN
jgi:hypothetical protein